MLLISHLIMPGIVFMIRLLDTRIHLFSYLIVQTEIKNELLHIGMVWYGDIIACVCGNALYQRRHYLSLIYCAQRLTNWTMTQVCQQN